jgi:predicted GNAT superfamily acetyltransferase
VSSNRPELHIRDVRDADLAAVHAINEAAVPHVNSISLDRFQGFTHEAAYFRVALLDVDESIDARADESMDGRGRAKHDARAELAGYLVAFDPGARYDSLNFLWFHERYKDFIYIDRIAVAASARRHGVASGLYQDFFEFARPRTDLVTCEVNTRPVNAESMAFHESFGFREVGTQETGGDAKTVSLMAVELNAPG